MPCSEESIQSPQRFMPIISQFKKYPLIHLKEMCGFRLALHIAIFLSVETGSSVQNSPSFVHSKKERFFSAIHMKNIE